MTGGNMLLKTLCSVLVLGCLFNHVESARILAVFPMPSISHQIVFRPYIHELAKKGHDVTVITPDPAFPKGKSMPNLKEIDVHDIAYTSWKVKFVDKVPEMSSFSVLKTALKIMIDIANDVFGTPQVREEIFEKEQKFDLIVVEAVVPVLLGLAHKYNAPIIQMSSFFGTMGNYETQGAPTHVFLYPEVMALKVNNLTLLDKLKKVAFLSVLRIMYRGYYVDKVDVALKEIFGQDTPTLYELEERVDMLFVNIYSIWESNRPVPPSVLFLGGLHLKPVKELPDDFKTYLDSSKNGVIYVSFGTNVNTSTLPEHKLKVMTNVFSKLPYDIMWKWDQDDLPNKPKNVKTFKWAPQYDILNHPNVKLFITQGGIQSTDESISAGVPLIGIPMLVDQYSNVERYESHNIGIKQLIDTLNEEDFHNAIMKIMTDESYRKNVLKLRSVMQDTPQTPLEKALWWTEHILRHGGGQHLKGPAANISWWQYLEIELLFTLFLILSAILGFIVLIFYGIVKLIVRCIVGEKKIKKH